MRHWTCNVVLALQKSLADIQKGFEQRTESARHRQLAAERTFKDEKSLLDAEHTAACAAIDQAAARITAELGKVEQDVRTVLTELQKIWDKTRQHGSEQQFFLTLDLAANERSFRVRPPDERGEALDWTAARILLGKTQQRLNGGTDSETGAKIQGFLSLQKPAKLIRSGGMGCLGFFVANVAAAMAVSVVNSSRFFSDFAVGAWFLVFIGACIAQIAIARTLDAHRLSSAFHEIISACLTIEHSALIHLQEAKAKADRDLRPCTERRAEADRKHQAVIAAAEIRILAPARRQYNEACEAAKAWETTQLKRTIARFTPIVNEAHHLRELLVENLGYLGAAWDSEGWNNWAPLDAPASVFRAGSFVSEDATLSEKTGLPIHTSVPALFPLTGQALTIENKGTPPAHTFALVRSIMLRLLATMPPSKLQYLLIDPVGLGQNVASFMHLADHYDKLVSGRVWTESRHIEEQLTLLTEDMELIIQKRLRNEYANIAEYNRKAAVAEAYRLLVVFDFPANFTDSSARRLVSIVQNGPRCGVFSVIVINPAKPRPYGFELSDLTPHCIQLSDGGTGLLLPKQGIFLGEGRMTENPDREHTLDKELASTFVFRREVEPRAAITDRIVRTIGPLAKKAAQPKVPFATMLRQAGLTEEHWWSKEYKSADGIAVPLGPRDATRIQELSIGSVGSAHHGLIVGTTGSGKSNLMHVIITGLALKYSPEEIQLYLVDFKQGVEFQCYARYQLPHARVVAIETEREFGLSVLRGLNQEMLDRGEKFRKLGAQNISQYRQLTRQLEKPLPRILLVIDEFQVLFAEGDELGRECAGILDNLASQGRNAGIHVLLASQTLSRHESIRKSTMSQMNIRIALQLTEADVDLVMAHGNTEARTLSQPGEAIYNDKAGLLIGNQHFQVALFSEGDRDHFLRAVATRATQNGFSSSMIVFEGNEPASIEKGGSLDAVVDFGRQRNGKAALLGEPIEIKPPTVALLRRQSATNLAIVCRDELEGAGTVMALMLSLIKQGWRDRICLVDFSTPGSTAAEVFAALASHPRVPRYGRRDLPGLMQELRNNINARLEQPTSGGEIYLLIFGLQRARDLRSENTDIGEGGVSLPDLFSSLVREGPEVGLHIITWCDTYANFSRVVDRRLKSEFSLRAAGAMSLEDSGQFVDDSAASRLDKPHRMLFYDEERPGVLEKFRPFGLPDLDWLRRHLEEEKGAAVTP